MLQVVFSMQLGAGAVSSYASYNKFNQNIVRDALISKFLKYFFWSIQKLLLNLKSSLDFVIMLLLFTLTNISVLINHLVRVLMPQILLLLLLFTLTNMSVLIGHLVWVLLLLIRLLFLFTLTKISVLIIHRVWVLMLLILLLLLILTNISVLISHLVRVLLLLILLLLLSVTNTSVMINHLDRVLLLLILLMFLTWLIFQSWSATWSGSCYFWSCWCFYRG